LNPDISLVFRNTCFRRLRRFIAKGLLTAIFGRKRAPPGSCGSITYQTADDNTVAAVPGCFIGEAVVFTRPYYFRWSAPFKID
jgi:hypothetical protein